MTSQVFNIDCMEGMKQYSDKYFDLAVVDPPYGVNLQYNTYLDTENNWYELMDRFIPEIKRISTMVIMPSCSIKKLGWIYRNHEPDWLINWYKGSTGHAAYVGFNTYEPLLVYGKIKGIYLHDTVKIQNNVKMGEFSHPCPKPIKWYEHFYIKCLPNGGKVIDTFLGSGTSRIAADKAGNIEFVGYELDKEYFEAQEKRWSQYKMQQKLF